MGKVNMGNYGGDGKPALKPDVLPRGETAMVVTIADVDPNVEIPGEGNGPPRIAMRIDFAEFPESVYWPNMTSIRNLVAGLGSDDTDDWLKRKVPLETVTSNNPKGGGTAKNLWVPSPDEWGDFGVRVGVRGASSRSASPVRRKRTTKKRAAKKRAKK